MQSSVLLKTGQEISTPMVKVVHMALGRLFESKPAVFFDFVSALRNPKEWILRPETVEILNQYSLMEGESIRSEVRLIALASVEGEGLEMKLVSPVAEKQFNDGKSEEKICPLDNYELYVLVRKIADIIFEVKESSEDSFSREDRREQSSNPYYSQSADGVFLEFYYSSPSKLWTPWGQWNFMGGGTCWPQELLPEIFERLGAREYMPERHSQMGTFGPVYSLHKVDDTSLPIPVDLENGAYSSYEDVTKAWADLTEKYYKSQGIEMPLSYEERSALDDVILKERGEKEPRLTDSDIHSVEGLISFAGQAVKFSKNGGDTWKYALLWRQSEHFREGGYGFAMYEEVMPNVDVHCRGSFTDKDFGRGLIVRPVANESELEGVRFSYDRC